MQGREVNIKQDQNITSALKPHWLNYLNHSWPNFSENSLPDTAIQHNKYQLKWQAIEMLLFFFFPNVKLQVMLKLSKNAISLVCDLIFWVCFYNVHQLASDWCLSGDKFAWWKKGRSGVHRKKQNTERHTSKGCF